jgi:hypothetical protein
MWDHIALLLPPKPPKLAPVISCCKVDGSTGIHQRYRVSISKAVSEEEVRLLMPNAVENFERRFLYTAKDILNWGIPIDVDFYTLDKLVSNACMLGWDFPADGDRDNYNKRERFFRLVKK